jgi:hypothetical protein
LLAALGAIAAPASHAALGGDVASVLRDHAALRIAPVLTSTASYDVYSGETSGGTALREYVDRSGKVFAVGFNGPSAPQVMSVLGSYSARYLAAAKARRPARHVVVINDPDLSVSSVRLPRGWQFGAQLPASIPAGVDRSALR